MHNALTIVHLFNPSPLVPEQQKAYTNNSKYLKELPTKSRQSMIDDLKDLITINPPISVTPLDQTRLLNPNQESPA
jgi:hypothetical protein